MKRRESQTGFTILELMIASAVFAAVLLVITVGLIQIGRLFFKGVTISRTQEVTRSIVDDISRAILFGGGDIQPTLSSMGTDVALTGPGPSRGFCVGTTRYSFIRALRLTNANHVLVADRYTSPCNGSTLAQNMSSLSATSRELMSPGMRLVKLDVQDRGNSLYAITVRIIYGEDDLLCSPLVSGDCDRTNNATSVHLNNPDLACKAQYAGGQFCAASELSTTVQKRIE